jgi:hypothetical protein
MLEMDVGEGEMGTGGVGGGMVMFITMSKL